MHKHPALLFVFLFFFYSEQKFSNTSLARNQTMTCWDLLFLQNKHYIEKRERNKKQGLKRFLKKIRNYVKQITNYTRPKSIQIYLKARHS